MQLKTNSLKFLTKRGGLVLGLMLFIGYSTAAQEIIEEKTEEKKVENKVVDGQRMKLDGVAAVVGG